MKHNKNLFQNQDSKSKRKVSQATSDKGLKQIRRSPRTNTGISEEDRNYPLRFLSKPNQLSISKYVSKSSDKRKSLNNSNTKVNKENRSSSKNESDAEKAKSVETVKRRKSVDVKKTVGGNKNYEKSENKSKTKVKFPAPSKTRTSQISEGNHIDSKINTPTNSRKRKMDVYELSPEMKKSKYYEDDIRKWKSLDRTTLSFVMTLVNTGIDAILLSKSLGEDYSTVRECLHGFQNRLTSKLTTLKTPPSRYKDYRKIHKLTVEYKDELQIYEDQEITLFDAVEQEEMDCENLKDEIEKERHEQENLAAMAEDCELHPLLKAYEHYKPVLTALPLPT